MSQPPKNPKCLFCQIVAKTLPADIIYEDYRVMAFRDINPKAETHVLCIPKQHYGTLMKVSEIEADIFQHLFLGVQRVAKRLSLDGFKLVVNNGPSAGQVVPHVHIHILAGRKIKDFSSI